MQPLFYHVRRAGLAPGFRKCASAFAVAGALAAGCGRPTSEAVPPPQARSTPAARADSTTSPANSAPEPPQTTPTAAAIASGQAIIERVRSAAGGPALTALRSVMATGTSQMSVVRDVRLLSIMALFPQSYRQEEAPKPAAKGRLLHVTMGLQGDSAWMSGAVLGGDGQSLNREVAERAYTRAVRQAMAGFLIGVDTPWLFDTGKYTVTDAGTVDLGDDRGALAVLVDGPDGRVGRILIDPGTHLPRRFIEPPQPGGGGAAAVDDIVFTYSDYKPQAGLQLPHTIVRENGRNRTVWSIKEYTLNPRLSPRQFSRTGR